MHRFVIYSFSLFLTAAGVACSDDAGTTDTGTTDTGTTDTGTASDGATDTGTTDTGTASDGATDTGTTDTGTASDGATDGASGTPCGTETCDPATEVCFECACGGPTSFSCMTVPAACASDRTCTCIGPELCTTGLMMCTDRDDNHVFCDTGLD